MYSPLKMSSGQFSKIEVATIFTSSLTSLILAATAASGSGGGGPEGGGMGSAGVSAEATGCAAGV